MKRLVAVALTLALLGWLATQDGWRTVAEAAARLSPLVLVIGVGGLLLSYLLRALRVYDEFRTHTDAQGHRIAYGSCLRVVLIHNAMVNVVPFRGGEVAFPLLLQRQFDIALPRALAALLWFRLQDAFVVLAVAALIWPGLAPEMRAVIITALFVLAWYLPRWAARPPATITEGRLKRFLSKLRTAFAESTRHARFGWLWTIANWSVKLAAQAWLLAHVLGSGLVIAAAGVLGAELAAIQPVQGVAGFGSYEAGAAAALLTHGVTLSDGLKAALVLHLIVIASAVACGAIAWLWPGARGVLDARETTSPP